MKNIEKKYKFAVIATDVVIFTIKDEALNVLLIKMKKEPFTDRWAVPGGLIKGSESVDEAAKRVLCEKAGVKNVFLEQLYTFGKTDRDPFGRVVSVAYYALIPSDGLNLKTTKEYADIGWYWVNDLPKMAYDHKEIINFAMMRLQSKLEYTNIVYSLLPEEFTLTDLQKTYEIILNKEFDKRNFRKKILALKLIKPTGEKQVGSANRPAALYNFITREPKNIEIL